jgi:hypothetical protein
MVNAQFGVSKAFSGLWRPLSKVVDDPQLKRAASKMDEKVQVFNKLRRALAIADPKNNKELNDDGDQTDIKSIEEEVEKFRKEILMGKAYRKNDDYQNMIKQLDKYWEKLFADPIEVSNSNGQFTIQPQRTNNMGAFQFR